MDGLRSDLRRKRRCAMSVDIIAVPRVTNQMTLSMKKHQFAEIPAVTFLISGEWVCVPADTKEVYEDQGGSSKTFTTVVACGNAAGVILPPYIIYGAKTLNPLWCERGPNRAQYRCSNKGWITEDLFFDWFQKLFLVETIHIARPLLLLMDNLSAHISIRTIELAQKHQVILLCFPPNTTHALQPLDVVTFGFVLFCGKRVDGISDPLRFCSF